MQINFWLKVFGKDFLAHLPSHINRVFSEQNHHLTKLGIRSLRDKERCMEMGVQLALNGLYLNLDTTRTDHIILTP